VQVPFAVDVAGLQLEPGELSADQILDGAPTVAERTLTTSADGRHETGVWEITAGVSTDVEAEEVFVVISGRAQVEVEGGPVLELAPGVVGFFAAGDRTVWRVSETLRKVYTVTLP
jgi:hypothetical protein